MSDLLLIRHGPTAWNATGRIQGHRDVPLSPEGRARLAGRGLPGDYAHFRWFASPLIRAVETAALLGARDLETDPRLMELDWGEWEGATRRELEERHGRAFTDNAARGLDFRPPGGESPRELRARLEDWVAETCAVVPAAVVVTHKGIIQMALALATGWDLVSRSPVRLDWRCGQHFAVAGDPPRMRLVAPAVALARHGGEG